MTPALEKLRDREIDKVLTYHACASGDCPHEKQDECFKELMRIGFDVAITALEQAAGEWELPEIGRHVAHPQSVWFETHWRPVFDQMKARIGVFRQSAIKLTDMVRDLEARIKELSNA
jgi:hypothetical protein